MSRTKGASFERRIAKTLSLKFYNDTESVRRTPLSGGWSTKYAGGDVVGDETFPLYVECRNREVWKTKDLFNPDSVLYRWYKESIEQARVYKKEAILIFTRNYEERYIMTRIFVNDVYPHIQIGRAPKAVYIFLYDDWIKKLDKEIFYDTTKQQCIN